MDGGSRTTECSLMTIGLLKDRQVRASRLRSSEAPVARVGPAQAEPRRLINVRFLTVTRDSGTARGRGIVSLSI